MSEPICVRRPPLGGRGNDVRMSRPAYAFTSDSPLAGTPSPNGLFIRWLKALDIAPPPAGESMTDGRVEDSRYPENAARRTDDTRISPEGSGGRIDRKSTRL